MCYRAALKSPAYTKMKIMPMPDVLNGMRCTVLSSADGDRDNGLREGCDYDRGGARKTLPPAATLFLLSPPIRGP